MMAAAVELARPREDIPAAERLKITETFLSLQGEADAVGWPTFFIRLTGSPLRSRYSDTDYAFYGGHWRAIRDLVAEARASGARHVCVTGGEPLRARPLGRSRRVLWTSVINDRMSGVRAIRSRLSF